MEMVNNITHFESKACRRVRGLLDDFSAGELTVETSQEILDHLERCRGCRREEERRTAARLALKEAWNSQLPPARLRSRILHDLSLDRRSLPSFFRLAAGIVLLVTLSVVPFWFPGRPAVDHYALMARDHLNCRGELAGSAVPLPLEPVRARLLETLTQEDVSFQLVQTTLCRVGGVRFIHYLFEDHGQRLSLMLEPRPPRGRLMEEGARWKGVLHGVRVISQERQSVTLVSFEGLEYFVYLAAEEQEPEQTLRYAKRLIPSLKAAL